MENITLENNSAPEANNLSLKFKRYKTLVITVVVVVIFIIVALFFMRGLFVAATINGSPISRLSVIQELEKRGGKQALESLIDKKLIETELSRQNVTVTQEEIDEEMKKIETEIASQGETLDQALAMQGMTKEELMEQITIQKRLEKLLADKVVITDAEVDAYLKDSTTTSTKDVSAEDFREQISDQLKQQKFQQEAQKWMSDLTANAKIEYYVNY